MVYQKRTTQARWTVKAPAESNSTYDKELTKPELRRSNSGDTDLSDSGKFSSSSGDESWDNASIPGTPPTAKNSSQTNRTKLSGESKLFVPKQPVQGTEQRTRLSSGASVFVPGQTQSQQMMQTYTPQPEMYSQWMPMDQSMGYMPCYYMAADGSTWGMCPVAVPVLPGAAPFIPEVQPEPAMKPQTPKKEPVAAKQEPVKDPAFMAAKFVPTESSKSRWADLDEEEDEEYEDPWLKK